MRSCLFIEMNQTAHISLQIPSMSKSVAQKGPRQNQPEAPHLFGATRIKNLKTFSALPCRNSVAPPSRVPLCAISAAGEGGSRLTRRESQPLFLEKWHIGGNFFWSLENKGFRQLVGGFDDDR